MAHNSALQAWSVSELEWFIEELQIFVIKCLTNVPPDPARQAAWIETCYGLRDRLNKELSTAQSLRDLDAPQPILALLVQKALARIAIDLANVTFVAGPDCIIVPRGGYAMAPAALVAAARILARASDLK
jgi:hypothetical protein